ncbi:MAG: hypothetical protein JNJ78_08610 [Anaerolineae bacterium]|nr:hypothetical protein [Anaerolineae bacterium]
MSPYSPLQLAEAFIRTGELGDALEALNNHLDSMPEDAAARRLRVDVLMRLPGADYARRALADLDQLVEVTAEDWVQRSVILQGLGDTAGCSAAMAAAYRLQPEDERLIERYLSTLEQNGQIEEARRLVDEQPATWRWLQIAGELAERAGDGEAAYQRYSEAVSAIERRLDTERNRLAGTLKGMLVVKRAGVAYGLGLLEQAEADYRAASDYFPKDLSYPLMQAAMLWLKGEQGAALELAQQVLRDMPALTEYLRDATASDGRLTPFLEAVIPQDV